MIKVFKYFYYYSKLIFKTLNKFWFLLFIFSISFCFTYEVFLINTVAPVDWFVGLGKFSSQFFYGYIGGFAFYFLTVHIPMIEKRIKLSRYIHNHICLLDREISNLFGSISKNKISKIDKSLTSKEIESYLLEINPNLTFHENGMPVKNAPQF